LLQEKHPMMYSAGFSDIFHDNVFIRANIRTIFFKQSFGNYT